MKYILSAIKSLAGIIPVFKFSIAYRDLKVKGDYIIITAVSGQCCQVRKMWENFYAFCTTVNKKFHTHIYERGKNGGAGVIKDEQPSVSVFSPSKASSISSSGILSMLNGFLLALMMRVK